VCRAAAQPVRVASTLPRPPHPPPPHRRQQNQGLLPPGTKFDLFRGAAQQQRDEVETYPSALDFKVGRRRAPRPLGPQQACRLAA
jgi:hypothetical protein